MKKQEMLDKLPERIRDKITITDKHVNWAISHPYVADESLFALTREAIEKMGGKYQGYFDGRANYELSKTTTKDVTPHVVSMDKTEPPKLGMDSEVAYKEVRNGFPTEIGVKLIDVDKLVQSPYWPRELNVEDETFKELVESIRKYGVQGNLLARLKDGRLELVFGHRRLFAARQAGLKVVPVKIRDLTDEKALETQFEENDKQKHWTDIETARYLKTMMEKLSFTQQQIAERLNKSQPWVSTHLMMLKDEIITRVITSSKTLDITEGKARIIRKLPAEAQEQIAKEVEETGKLPSPQSIRDLAQLHKCDVSGCLARTDVNEWNGREIYLCPKHMKEAELNPAKFLGLKRTKVVTETMKTIKPTPIKDTWEQRKARTQPQHSRMEEAQLLKLQQANLKPVATDREFCVKSTTPDLYFPTKHLAIYLDGPVHIAKEDRDDKIRTALAKQHDIKVASIKHDRFTEKEVDRVFLLVKEAYEHV